MSGTFRHVEAAPGGDLLIRRSAERDLPALARLAQRDSAPPPAGAHLVAEEDGRVLAALPLAGGPPLADPFHRTADLVAMLELRAGRLRTPSPSAERRRGLAARLRRPARARVPARAEHGLPLPRGAQV